VNGVTFGPGGELFAVGSIVSTYFAPADGVARFDGAQWLPLQNLPSRLGRVRSIAASDDGTMYVAYDTGCARWTGSNWFSISGQVAKNIGTPTIWSIAMDGSSNLWAGGAFDGIGGIGAVNLARWDGTNWFATGFDAGPGAQTTVNTVFCGKDGKVYVGVWGGIQVWDGTNWSDAGLQGDIWSLAMDKGGRLYAGGSLWEPSDHLAWLDGTNWTGLNVDYYVWSLTADKVGGIYAGGIFSTVGGMPSKGVARWNGSAWEPIGTIFSSTVYAVTLDDYGNLYAGVGGRSWGVGLWDGTSWRTLGSGIDNTVYALRFDKSRNLYAGGVFGRAGTNYSTNFARASIPLSPRNLGVSLNKDGKIEMELQGPAGQPCVLEQSPDFVNWTSVSTNISSVDGLWRFTNGVSGYKNFYRSVLR
jgi:hypothetical protein